MWKIRLLFLLIFQAYCFRKSLCRKYGIHTKIYHGEVKQIEKVPYYVQIVRTKSDDRLEELGQFCGGVIISEDWILTTAQCLEDEVKEDIRVVSGTSDKCSNEDLENYSRDFAQEFREISGFVTHKKFDSDSLINDIALIKLSNSIEFNDKQRPIEIRDMPLTREIVTISGMGWDPSHNKQKSKLKSIVVAVLDTEVCQKKYFPLNIRADDKITENMFCAGMEKKHGCKGDAGDPAVDRDGFLVGLVSWGSSYGCKYKAPNVLTNVIKYRIWIRNQMKNPKFDY